MPNSTLTALPAASALDGTELYYSVQAAADTKVTGAQIKTWTSASPTLVTPTLGVASGTSLALGGATIGGNAFAVTGTSLFNSGVTFSAAITYGGVALSNSVTGTGSMVLSIGPTITGHPTIEGVTSTGATGTGKFVFDGTPTLVTPVLGVATGTSLALNGATLGTAKLAITGSVELTLFALTDGATPALDASQGMIFTLSASGDRTIAVPSNASVGQKIIIRHFANGGARTLSLNTGANGFRFGSDITGLTQTASGKYDYIGCIWNDTASFWDVVAYVKGY